MKKLFLVCLVSLVSLLVSTAGFAENLNGRVTVGINNAVAVSENDMEINAAGIDVGIKPAYNVSGSISYGITNNLLIEAECGWARLYPKENTSGKIDTIPLLGNLVYRFNVEKGLNPYVFGGLGVMFSDYRESGLEHSLGLGVDIEPTFCMQAGVGMDCYLTENLALNTNIRYLFADMDWDLKQYGTSVGKIESFDADRFAFGVGLKYSF